MIHAEGQEPRGVTNPSERLTVLVNARLFRRRTPQDATLTITERDDTRYQTLATDGVEMTLPEHPGDFGNWRDPGDDLPPLRLTIPIRDYILDADDSDEEEVELFFRQPPVEQVRRIYTIDEVKRSARIRDSVRRLEVGGLTFDSGAATISRSQVGALSKVANAMLDQGVV